MEQLANGCIAKWLGIDTYEDGVGYKHIKIKPHLGGGFTYASVSLDTYYRKVCNSWKIENGSLLMEVEIPANTTATVFVPAKNSDAVKESDKALSKVNDIKLNGNREGCCVGARFRSLSFCSSEIKKLEIVKQGFVFFVCLLQKEMLAIGSIWRDSRHNLSQLIFY